VDESTASPPDHAQQPAGASVEPPAEPGTGFRARGRVRRRARFLRKARELAYRDLGGLVYNLHRFGQRNDPLVLAKLSTLTQIDSELRSIEAALSTSQPVTVLREAGVTACPRCAAIHSGEDRFCPGCGLPLSRHVDLPISGAVSSPAVVPSPAVPVATATQAAPGATAQQPTPAAPAATAHARGTSLSGATAPGAGPPASAPEPQSPTAAPTPPAPGRVPAGRSPVPPPKAQPAPSSSDVGEEQPTQAFPSGAPST
jgi:hypothetical protein